MKLIGAINPLAPNPCFAVPLFEEENSLYFQITLGGNKIHGFEKINSKIGVIIPIHDDAVYKVGCNSVYAFDFGNGDIFSGEKELLSLTLKDNYNRYFNRPFLLKEIAEFLCDENILNKSNALIFDLIYVTRNNENSKSQLSPKTKKDNIKYNTNLQKDSIVNNTLRLSIFRSNKHIYAQMIDIGKGQTIFSASTMECSIRPKIKNKNKTSQSKIVGQILAKRVIAKGSKVIEIALNEYKIHGRVKALIEPLNNLPNVELKFCHKRKHINVTTSENAYLTRKNL